MKFALVPPRGPKGDQKFMLSGRIRQNEAHQRKERPRKPRKNIAGFFASTKNELKSNRHFDGGGVGTPTGSSPNIFWEDSQLNSGAEPGVV